MSDIKNPHTGSTLDSILEDEEVISQSELDLLSKSELIELEELAKACPRCGKASANSSNPSGRCRKHLNKLAADKQKPGHWQRAQTLADGSLRRQNGENGTASHKSKGRGNRKDIVGKMKSAEKKTGQKLSPDRVDNSRGYGSGKSGKSNLRAVPVKLNRGRHHVDPKKLKAWKARLAKSDISPELLYTSLLAKATEEGDTASLTLLQTLAEDGLMKYIDVFDDSDVAPVETQSATPETDKAATLKKNLQLILETLRKANNKQ